MDAIAKRINASYECAYERDQLKKFADRAEKDAWYHDPTIVWGSVAVGVSLAAIVGYALGAKAK